MYNVDMATTPDTTVRLPRELIEQVRKLAIEHDRSLSAELREALRAYVRHHETEE
jgi:predicted transcriptional regulator